MDLSSPYRKSHTLKPQHVLTDWMPSCPSLDHRDNRHLAILNFFLIIRRYDHYNCLLGKRMKLSH